jgi:TonB-linked SusC/RagA family outer membrane protein
MRRIWQSLFAVSLTLLFGSSAVLAQEHTVEGTVYDAQTNLPLPAVNVAVAGTTQGTSTDEQGRYRLTAPTGADSLIFSFIGYELLTVGIDSRARVDVWLTASVEMLGDVVVTALGITREQRSIGYAAQQVDGDNLTFTNEQNVIGSLSGKIAGVQVVGASGASMGGTSKIKIRGVNSLGAGDQPLIVVDGTPISNANYSGSTGRDYGNLGQDVNPADIESVNVLKGPAASALYGIRGQYGVILITTKQGRRGAERFTVELSSSASFERVANIMPYQNLYGGGSTQNWNRLPNGDPYVQVNVDESWGPRMDGTMVRHVYSFFPQDPEYGQLAPFVPQPNNIRDYFDTGSNLSQTITVSGGGQNSRLRFSFNDTRVTGVEPNTFLNRNNVGLSAGIDLSEQWNVSTNVNYARNNARRPTQGAEAGSRYFGQWFQRSVDMNRLRDYAYDDGTILHWNVRSPSSTTGEVSNLSALYFANPFFIAYENPTNDSRDRIFGNVGLTFRPVPQVSLSGYIRGDMFTQNIDSRNAFGGTGTPSYFVGKYQNSEMNYEVLAQYDERFGDISLNANVGGNVYDRTYTYLSQGTVGGLSAPGFYNIDASIDRPTTNSYRLEKRVVSGYGLLSLGFRDTYFIDASIRNDRSSALPEDNNSYWYPSVGGSFVFSELIDWEPLAMGKIRMSYAQAGSDLNPYQTTPIYTVGTVYGGVSTLGIPSTLNNPNIEPSFANSYEAGFDLNFGQRFEVNFTYYQQKNRNQIIPLNVSGASGYGSATINAGLIENNGIELALSGTPVLSRQFSWETSVNFSRNNNMVVELHPDIDVYGYGSTRYSAVSTFLNSYEGKPFGTIVGQAYQRDEATGMILLDQNNLPMYTDATHHFGSALPDLTGGFQNVLKFRGFDLAAMIDFQIGGQFFSRSQSLADRTGLSEASAALNDRGMNVRDPIDEGGGIRVEGISSVTGERVVAYVNPRSYYGVVARRIAEDYIYDASYVKLRELRLGYNVGQSLMRELPFQRARISLIARNPLMIWQDAPKGLDPSELSTGSQAISWYESGQLNSVRSFGLNLNLTY